MTEEVHEVPAVIEAEVVGDPQDAVTVSSDSAAIQAAIDNPRSIEAFRKDLYQLATMDEDSARAMYYTVKRGKVVEGPSIRFAECVIYAFGNLETRGFVTDVGATTLKAIGMAWDLQRGTRVAREVSRRITYSDGSRYTQDMINVTGNAAVSIAIRNAVLTLVPTPFYQEAYEAALKVAAGDEKTIKRRRKEWTEWWKNQGGTEEQLWEWLDVKGPDDVGGFEIRRLFGFRNALEEGGTTFQREMDLMSGAETGEEEADALDAAIMSQDTEEKQ